MKKTITKIYIALVVYLVALLLLNATNVISTDFFGIAFGIGFILIAIFYIIMKRYNNQMRTMDYIICMLFVFVGIQNIMNVFK